MPRILMLATAVAVTPGQAVVELQGYPDPTDEFEAHGSLRLTIPLDEDEDADFDEIEQGEVYTVTLHKSSAPKGSAIEAHQGNHQVVQLASRISNSTNDPNYKTPAEQKLPPPLLPDGVVTEPRPSVIMEPVKGSAPATAGVVSPGPATVAEQVAAGQDAKSGAGKK